MWKKHKMHCFYIIVESYSEETIYMHNGFRRFKQGIVLNITDSDQCFQCCRVCQFLRINSTISVFNGFPAISLFKKSIIFKSSKITPGINSEQEF